MKRKRRGSSSSIAAVKVAEALGVDPAEVKPGAKVTKIIAIKYAEDEAPIGTTLWRMDTFAHALGKFGRPAARRTQARRQTPECRLLFLVGVKHVIL